MISNFEIEMLVRLILAAPNDWWRTGFKKDPFLLVLTFLLFYKVIVIYFHKFNIKKEEQIFILTKEAVDVNRRSF